MLGSRFRATAVLTALSALALSTPASGQVAQAASMNLQGFVDSGCDTKTSTSTDAWGALLASLNVSVDAELPDCNTGGLFGAFGTGAATWASAAAGNVAFANFGFAFNNSQGTASMNGGGPDWLYTFMATGNGTFSMNGTVTGTGDTFGLWGWALSINGGPEGLRTGGVQNAFDPTSTWNFTGGLTAGNVYTVSLLNNANIRLDGPGTRRGTMDGAFDWTINTRDVVTTPEPATLALVFPGLLAAAMASRRRKRR